MRRLIAILLILAISVTAFSSCETKNTEEDPITLQGETGNGIASIEKTSTEGLVDTYTITYTDGTTTTFTVTNGRTYPHHHHRGR